MFLRSKQIDIVGRHHSSIPDKYNPPQSKPLLDILQHTLDRRRISLVSLEHVMRDRPAVDHHLPHENLAVARLAITAMPMFGQALRTVPLEIGRRQIVENQIYV